VSEQSAQPDSIFANKVDAALKKMASDKRIKRTKGQLAKMLGVSRGTLYNHGWPITRLEAFCLEEKQKESPPKRSDITHTFNQEKSDAELYRWKHKCDALKVENEVLKARIEELRKKLLKRGGPDEGDNIISFPTSSKSD
jgi:hypothetical protein